MNMSIENRCNMGNGLLQLQQKVAMKPVLEAKLRELQNQGRESDWEVISL